MLRGFKKKIESSFLLKSLALFIFVMTIFALGSGHFFVRAFSNQINIFPSTYSTAKQEELPFWAKAENIFFQDLSSLAAFDDFNMENSLYLAWSGDEFLDDKPEQTQESQIGSTTEAELEEEAGLDNQEQDPSEDNQDSVQIEKETTTDYEEVNANEEDAVVDTGIEGEADSGAESFLDPIEEDSSSDKDEENLLSDEPFLSEDQTSELDENSASDSTQEEDRPSEEKCQEEASISEPETNEQSDKTEEADDSDGDSADLSQIRGSRLSFTSLISAIAKADWYGFNEAKAEDEGHVGVVRDIIFENFSVPLSSEQVGEMQLDLNLSLAAKSHIKEDKLFVFYQKSEEDEWSLLEIMELDEEFSNENNDDYYKLVMPGDIILDDVANLKIKLSFQGERNLNSNIGAEIYIDALWLQMNYDESEELSADEPQESGDSVLEDDQDGEMELSQENEYELDLLSTKTDFKTSERPEFNFKYRKNKGLIKKLIDGIVNVFRDEYKGLQVKAKIKGLRIDGEVDLDPKVRYLDNGEFEVYLPSDIRSFKPGKYSIDIEIDDRGSIYKTSQDFSWGVLAMNFNKSIYEDQERAYIQMAVLDEDGNTICEEDDMVLKIRKPDGTFEFISTHNKQINYNPLCDGNNVIDEPDYFSYFSFDQTGYYDFELTVNNDNGEFVISEQIEVVSELPYVIKRSGPTRIYPKALYRMNISVEAKEDYQGEFTEKIPASFGLPYAKGVELREKDKVKDLVWQVNWEKGEKYEYSYIFDAPNVSPEFYLLGPAQTRDFKEARKWQIASDAPAGEIGHGFVSYDAPLSQTLNFNTDGWSEVSQYIIPASNFTAGDRYLVMVNFSINNDSTNDNPMARVRHGNTEFSDSTFAWESRRSGVDFVGNGYQYFTVWTAQSGEDIHVDISLMGNRDSTVYTEGYQAFVMNLDDLTENSDWYYDTASHSGNLGTTWSTDGASISINGNNQDWLVMGMGRFLSDSTTANFQMRLNNTTDASTYSEVLYEAEDTADYRPIISMTGDSISGTETWRVDAQVNTSNTHDWELSKILAINLDAFREHSVATSTANTSIAPQSSWVQTNTVSHSVESSVDTFVWSNEVLSMGENRKVPYSRIQVDNVTTPSGFEDYSREVPAGDVDVNAFHDFFVSELSLGTRVIDVELMETVDDNPASVANSHNLVVFSMEMAPISVINVLGQEQYESDGSTTLANGAFSDGDVVLEAIAADYDTGTSSVDIYFELIASSSSFTLATSTPVNYCLEGTNYESCSYKIWKKSTSTSATYPVTKLAIDGVTSGENYKWQVMVCDNPDHCSDWSAFNETLPNFKVDNEAPSAPGALTLNNSSSNSVTLNFGASSSEDFFDTYKIFYKQGSSGVNETDIEHSDINLGYIDYNGAVKTTINNLTANTDYVFNIWVYDQAGFKASSTEISVSTTEALSASAQKQFKANLLTELANGAWTNESEINLSAIASDSSASTTEVDFYFELLDESGTFSTASSVPATSCSNGTAYSSCPSKIWTVFASSSAWYDEAWIYRKKISINASQVYANLTNFPVLATTTDINLAYVANGGHMASSTGGDIVVTDSDAVTPLNFEREYYNPSTGEIALWINTDISSTSNKDLYIYYANENATVDMSTTTGVWDANYTLVQHLNEISGTHYDSTANYNHSSLVSVSDQNASGYIDGADEFGGSASGDQVDIGISSSLNALSTITAEAWVNTDSSAIANQAVLGFRRANNDRAWLYMSDSINGFRVYNDINNSNVDVATTNYVPGAGEWHHIAWVIDGSYWRIYIDGVEEQAVSEALTITDLGADVNFSIGSRAVDNDYQWDGLIDEVRISNTPRSSLWLRTQYSNQRSVNNFMQIGEEESTPNANGIVNITEIPDRGSLADSGLGYKWQVIACNASDTCASWNEFNINDPNFKVDTTAPSAPGNLSLSTTTPTSIVLNFGNQAVDDNFSHYRVFYKKGLAGVSLSDTEHSDANLAYIDYNSSTTTTISSLEAFTQYVVNIWAYDMAGNKTSASEIQVTTAQTPHARARSVLFLAGNYSGNGSNGRLSDTNNSFSTFNFNLAETEVEIKNAYILFESQFEAYHNNSGSYSGFNLAFDACQEPCTANAFGGTGRVLLDDNSSLAFSETGSNQVRLLFDVSSEAQLTSYLGDGYNMEAQVGYRLETGSATSSISNAKATLVLTYSFDDDNSINFTNTVVYPLESNTAGDSGTMRAVQSDDCTKDTDCPLFSYNVEIPEIGTRLDQWFQAYLVNDGHGTSDVSVDVNIESSDVDSNVYIHESANGGEQANLPAMIFDSVYGFSENSAQSIEYHAESPGAASYYLLGAEVYETYTASKSASEKTRTVSFPVGIINDGQSATVASGSVDVYFPENGEGSGIVDIKKAWFRIISNNYEGVARSMTVSTKVGNASPSSNYIYNFSTGNTAIKPSFNIIHVIPATSYSELELANAINPKAVILNATNDSSNTGGVSAELMITYSYNSESSGYLSSINLFGGQSGEAANSQLSISGTLRSVFPELRGDKTVRGGALLSSYLITDSDSDVPDAWFTLGSDLSPSSPNCVNDFSHHSDAINSFTEYYRDISTVITVTDAQSYRSCYSNTNASDGTAGAKMNSIWLYTYQWDAPPSNFTQDDWRWYENADDIVLASAKADENTSISNVNIGDVLRLRMNLGLSGEHMATNTQTFKLQFAKSSDCGSATNWEDVGGLSDNKAWIGYNNPFPLDGATLNQVMLSSSTVSQSYEETNPSNSNPRSVRMGEYGEWDWAIYNKAASSSSDYCFRMVKASGDALDAYISGSYPSLSTAPANTAPANPSRLGQYYDSTETKIVNQSWINENDILLNARVLDPNLIETLTMYFELIENSSSFTTSTNEPVGACASGTDYTSCATKIWYLNSATGDYRSNPFMATTSIRTIPDSALGYKWQVLACDSSAACSSWVQLGTSPNIYVDNTPPSTPGDLIFNSSTPTTITLDFGASTIESNFDKYRIFYKLGNSGVTESDDEHIDANLGFIDYNSQSSTIIDDLSANTEYVFNIWAYDLAGNKATATNEVVGTTISSYTPPVGNFASAVQKTDGSGAIDVVISADDPDNDDKLRAKFFYSAGASCDFTSPFDPTLDELDANTTATYGDPVVDNDQDYQLGSSSGWIITSPGSNYVFFDWLSANDIPDANGTYCLGMVLSDGVFDLATRSRLMLIDNLEPTVPGALTLNKKSYDNITFNFGSESTDSRFSEYKIFYKVGTSTVSPLDIEFDKNDDPNLDYANYNGAATTTISGLTPNTTYSFNIFAYDSYGNFASSTSIEIKTNARPTNISADYQYKSDGATIITNGQWTDENSVVLRASAHDQDSNDLLTFYYQLVTTSGTFNTVSEPPLGTCSSGMSFGTCASGIWAVSTSTSLLPADWYNEDWLYRKRININANKILSNESDFPVLATTTDPNLASYARADAYDIFFTDSSGVSTLEFERLNYDSLTGEFSAWVKTDISSTTDTVIYMYYGNEAWTTDMSTTTGVWDNNFMGVWHLDENVIDESSQLAVHLDSTKYLNHASQFGNNEISANIFQSQYFDGIDDYISITDASNLDLSSAISIDFWLSGSISPISSSTVYTNSGTNSFIVPDGVTEITVKAWGAGGAGGAGGSNIDSEGGSGGGGAFAEATFKVSPGETLNVHIGGGGGAGVYDGSASGGGGGGGGRTELVRNSNSSDLLVVGAGAGGGGGDNSSAIDGGAGGAAGTDNGSSGLSSGAAGGGGGASLIAGGSGGTGGNNSGSAGASISGGDGADGRNGEGVDGSLANGGTTNGGSGGQATVQGSGFGAGGGGGSGYYGGGGGSSADASSGGAGGGGGSTYVATIALNSSREAGSGSSAANTDDPYYVAGVGSGGSGGASATNGSVGGDGLMHISYSLPVNIIAKGTDAYRMMIDDNNNLIAGINDQNATTTFDGNTHHVSLTYDQAAGGTDELKLFLDGEKKASLDYASLINTNASDIILGDGLNGVIDEFRISDIARSESWIKTTYNNISSVADFMSITEDNPVTSYYETTLVIDIPDNPASADGYKWQVMACDDDDDCTAWDSYNLNTPNFRVDTTAPTAPGQLTENNKSSNSITLSYGAPSLEDNFLEYKIFYSTTANVDESDIEISSSTDSSLAYIDYNGSSQLTVNNLDPLTTYYFNIWAYDVVGRKASSTETAITTSAAVSTPGVTFYTKNDQAIYYRIWDGNSWGSEQSSGNITAAGDNIRHLRTIRSDDGGKVGIVFKTWDGVNQEWWGTVYRYGANDFVDSSQLGSAYASSDNAQLITSCIAYLSGGEFMIVRNNNGSSGSLIYTWNPVDAWMAEGAGPDPGAVINGCELERRRGTDNYLLLAFDEDSDVGSAYYYGGSSYDDSWTNWTQHSSQETDLDNYVGQAFFDPSDNTRGAISFSNSATNNYSYAKYFLCDATSINYGAQVAGPNTAPDDWGNDFVHGEFSADPGASGIAYFAGRDVGGELNLYRVDVTSPSISWSTVSNGDNISAASLYSETNDSQKPFAIKFYENDKAVVSWLSSSNTTPSYRVLSSAANSVDATDTAVEGSSINNYTRVSFYPDPNVDEMLAIYENDDVDYSAVFWDGGSDSFFSSGNQAWNELVTNSGAIDADDEKTSHSFTGYNSSPNVPNNLNQFKLNATTSLANQSWTNQNSIKLYAEARDYDTSETLTLYLQLIAENDTFATSTDGLASACGLATDFSSCASKIWLVDSDSGDFSYSPFAATATITGISDSSIGYKWQYIACDDEVSCSAWSKFDSNGPNFKVDTLAPTAPGALTVASVDSKSVTLNFGSQSVEDNFSTYRIFYKQAPSGATLSDVEHVDVNLGSQNYGGASDTTVFSLASSSIYVFNIWAFDLAGNIATASPEIATSTHEAASIRQVSFLLENDDGVDVNSNTAEQAANTSLANLNIGERFNSRIQIENNGGDDSESLIYKLQFENQTDNPGTWSDVGVNTQISYASGLSGESGDLITSAKAGANSNWQDGYWYENAYQTASYILNKGYFTEFVFVLETSNALSGKTYNLRLYNETNDKTLETYSQYPSVSTVANEQIRYSKGLSAGLVSNNSDLTYYLDPEGYSDIAADDTNRDLLEATDQYPVFMFATKHSNNTDAASTTWNGQSSTSTSEKNVVLQVYRFGSSNSWVTMDTESSVLANTDFDLYAEINSSLSEYYDASNWIYWRVYQESGSQTLGSDYYEINFASPVPGVDQNHYRWRLDDNTETLATWLEPEDTGNSTFGNALGKGSTTRLRIEVANTGGGSASDYTYRLEYATSSNACISNFGEWLEVPVTATVEHFEMYASAYFDDGDPTTAQLSNSESYSFVSGQMLEDPSNFTSAITLTENQYTELEYMLYVTANAIAAETYCFRVTNSGTLLDNYSIYPAVTLTGSNNTAPYLSADPSDGGSASSTPTNENENVNFTITAQDDEGDDYYLAVCQTDSALPGNDGPPTCSGGAWCVSDPTIAGNEASCSYSAVAATEVNDWYAFVCDKRPGFGVAQCSPSSQGGGNILNDSPFAINHAPVLTNVTTLVDNQDPGSSFTISTVSSETDSAYSTDTLYLYVCASDSASFAGCAGGINDTICSAVATSSPNAKCSFTDIAPTPAGTNTYYAYLFDSHGLAASSNSLSSSYTINNVSPSFGTVYLNEGDDIIPNIRGGADISVSVVSSSTSDMNGCTDLVSAVSSVYISNVLNGPTCSPDDNVCYQITTDDCVISDCTGPDDTSAVVRCTTNIKYHVMPTDSYAYNSGLYWLGYMQLNDGSNLVSTSSGQVDVTTNMALDVVESLIDFGDNMFAGDDTGSWNATTTIVNAGNSPIDTSLSGTDMISPGYSIGVNYIEYSLESFSYNSGLDLNSSGVNVDIIAPRPTSMSTTSDDILWGVGIPFGADASSYEGINTFTVILDGDDW